MPNRDLMESGNPGEGPDYDRLVRYGARALPDALQMPDPGPAAGIGIWQYSRILWRRKNTIIAAAFLGALIGFIVLLPQSPVYRASASVEIQALNEEFLFSKDVNPNSNMGNMYPELDMATQSRILQTRILLDRVTARVTNDSSITVQSPSDRLSSWRKALHLPARPPRARAQMVAATAATVRITPSRNTRVIEISCDSGDPSLAAAFANAMASEYIDQTLETRWQSAQHTGAWLGRQLDEMKIKLEKSEEQLQSYAAAMKLVVTGDKDKVNISEDKLRQVQTELSAAEADRVAKQARYELVLSGRGDSLGPVLDDGTLRVFELKLADLRRELADLSTTLTPANVKVQKIQAQIANLETEQKTSRDRIVARIFNDFQEAERREKLLAAKYEAQSALVSNESGKLVHYNLLQREVDTDRQLYESLLQKVKESGISAALRASNIRVIDPAQAPSDPYAPNLKMGAAWGLLFGMFGGIGLAMILDRANRSIRIPGDAAFYLNVPLLGVIPSRSLDRIARLGRGQVGSRDAILTSFRGDKSATAEGFRSVLTSILFTGRRRPAQVVVVSSPNASEGKTTVACNLAMAYVEAGRTVLIIDADMRRPRLHEVFGISNEVGLAGLLSAKESLDARSLFMNVQPAGHSGLSVLPSGRPEAGTANLLHSHRLEELVQLAREQFDVILIDTPPMLQVADARIVGSLADGVVLIVRAGQTSRDSALAATEQLTEDRIHIVGVALNDWNPKVSGYYGYEYYDKKYY